MGTVALGICARVKDAEIALLSPETRSDNERVDQLLHDDFAEIGRSGRLWTRDEVLAMLADETRGESPQTAEWQFRELSPHNVLVTYAIVREGDVYSRHSSIWDLSSGVPRLRFHQGTRVAEH